MPSSRAHKMAKGQYSTGGAVGRALRTMRRHYADGGDVVKDRAMFLPLGTYGDGTTRAAWPGLLYEPAAAWKRMMDSGYRPGNAENTRKMAEDSFTVAGAVPLAGLAAGAVRGRMPRATLSSNAADDAAKRLPMDEASRMARAREMGFDTEQVYYHGTDAAFDAFDPSRIGQNFGDYSTGFHFSSVPSTAELNGGSAIMPVYLRKENPLVADYPNVGPVQAHDMDRNHLFIKAKRGGHDGMLIRGKDGEEHYVAFDPRNIRSVNATFDPDQIDSTNLLAANTNKASAPGLGALEANRVRQSLPMDEASRMARARELGFDLPAYHATSAEFTEFKPGYRGASFFADNADAAERGATYGAMDKYGTAAPIDRIMPVMLRSKHIAGLNLTPKERAWWESLPERADEKTIESLKMPSRNIDYWWRVYDEVQNPDGTFTYVKKPVPSTTIDEVRKTGRNVYGDKYLGSYDGEQYMAKSALENGMDGFILSDEAGVGIGIADPRRIRSTQAAFDPSQADSANLLASNPSTASVLSLLQDRKDRR